ncbi:MAG: BrnA antitoxin family protein [Candidatus Omnitrophota bacterium]
MKVIPKFLDVNSEKEFWLKNDSSDYIDWKKSKKNISFANLKPSIKSISLRLPETMLSDIKILANKKDVPYQSLMKIFLSQKIFEEFNK